MERNSNVYVISGNSAGAGRDNATPQRESTTVTVSQSSPPPQAVQVEVRPPAPAPAAAQVAQPLTTTTTVVTDTSANDALVGLKCCFASFKKRSMTLRACSWSDSV